jgi:uncharacterized membrane protein YdbT with pleckstrin-like domain
MTFPDAPKRANKRPAQGCHGLEAPVPKGAYTYRRGVETATFGACAQARRASLALIFLVLAMRYIERILQPGETLVYSGRIHWIIYLPAMILLLTLSWPLVSIACAVAAAVALLSAWFRRWTTEIDVTNRRIVYKRGFIRRHTVELNMGKVASVDVDQSIFGRMLNYGDITIHSTGTEFEPLHGIDAPLEFRNRVTAR